MQSRSTILLLAGIFFILGPFSAKASPTDDATKLLIEDVRPYVMTTTRALTVFNYSHGAPVDPDNLKHYVRGSAERTLKALDTLTKRAEYTAGSGDTSSGIPGFYTAFDPLESANYGGREQDWRLLTVQLPVGAKYLAAGYCTDESSTVCFELQAKPATRAAMKAAGCDDPNLAVIFLSPANAQCAQFAAATLRALSVQALLYPFGTAFRRVCPQQLSAALLLLDGKLIDQSTITQTTLASLTDGDRTQAKLLAGLANLVDKRSDNFDLVQSRFKSVGDPMPADQAKGWVDQNLFGCGPQAEKLDTSLFGPVDQSGL